MGDKERMVESYIRGSHMNENYLTRGKSKESHGCSELFK